jgi:hypothetical protein
VALIRYCEELKGYKPELSKKTMLDISITLDRHNLNFDMGKLLCIWSVSTCFRGFYKVLTLTADLKKNCVLQDLFFVKFDRQLLIFSIYFYFRR